jgi:hypothetical protein
LFEQNALEQKSIVCMGSSLLVGFEVAERLFAEGKLLFPAFSPFSQKRLSAGSPANPVLA